jgi:sec-independent protein translocase protein TatA
MRYGFENQSGGSMLPHLGTSELIIVLIIVIVLFGVGRIGRLGADFGRAIHEFRKAISDDEVEKKEI